MAFDFKGIFNDIAPIAKDIFTSYSKKDKATDNLTWLAQTFAKNKSTAADAAKLTEDVYSTINRFSANMRSIEQAAAIGKTKEQWLKNFIEGLDNMTEQQKGEYLNQANAALGYGNQVMMNAMQNPNEINITKEVNQLTQQELPMPANNVQWNRYTMAPTINQVGQQAVLVGANGMVMPIDMMDPNAMQGGEVIDQNIIEEERGSVIDEGLKMAAAAALKIGSVAGKIPFLPKAMPMSAITNIACVGVESFKNIGRVAMGKISPMQAMENIGRASIAAIADFCATGIPAKLLAPIPVVGPMLSVAVGGFLMSCSPEYIQQKIYAGIEKIKPIAQKIRATVSNAVNSVTNTVKNAVNNVMNVFK